MFTKTTMVTNAGVSTQFDPFITGLSKSDSPYVPPTPPTPAEELPEIVSHSDTQTLNNSVMGTIECVASGTNLRYQWQYFVDNATWTNVVGANGSVYVGSTSRVDYSLPTIGQLKRGAYRCVVSNSAGSVNTGSILLLVNTTVINILEQPQDGGFQDGRMGYVSIYVENQGQYSYKWFYAINNEGTPGTWTDCGVQFGRYICGTAIIGDGTPPAMLQIANGFYRCIVTAADGTAVTSNAALVTVSAPA